MLKTGNVSILIVKFVHGLELHKHNVVITPSPMTGFFHSSNKMSGQLSGAAASF
jgi:hypothetical protein